MHILHRYVIREMLNEVDFGLHDFKSLIIRKWCQFRFKELGIDLKVMDNSIQTGTEIAT